MLFVKQLSRNWRNNELGVIAVGFECEGEQRQLDFYLKILFGGFLNAFLVKFPKFWASNIKFHFPKAPKNLPYTISFQLNNSQLHNAAIFGFLPQQL